MFWIFDFLGLVQLRDAANAVGEVNLENKFAAASEGLGRGIMFLRIPCIYKMSF